LCGAGSIFTSLIAIPSRESSERSAATTSLSLWKDYYTAVYARGLVLFWYCTCWIRYGNKMWIIVFSSLLVLRLLKNTARVQYSPFDVLRETQVDEESTTQLACFTAMVTFPSFLRYGKGVEEPAGGGDSACEEDLPLDAA